MIFDIPGTAITKLTGNAGEMDVVLGKTFYNTDSRKKIIGKKPNWAKLWSGTQTDFAAQTITLDLSEYAAVAITFYSWAAYANTRKETAWVAVGSSGSLEGFYNYDVCYWVTRSVEVTESGVTFGAGTKRAGTSSVTSSATHAAAAVPVEIWGIPK